MKQHLKTKMLDDKALRLSKSSCQQQILYQYVIPSCKRSCKKEVTLNLIILFVYCNFFVIILLYIFDWRKIYDMIRYTYEHWTRKAIGFKYLRLNCSDISQVI